MNKAENEKNNMIDLPMGGTSLALSEGELLFFNNNMQSIGAKSKYIEMLKQQKQNEK